MMRPRRRASDSAASHNHPPASLAPSSRAGGLAWASSPTGPIQAAGRRRHEPPPWLPDRHQWGQVPVELSV
jgi:hypothetical protein